MTDRRTHLRRGAITAALSAAILATLGGLAAASNAAAGLSEGSSGFAVPTWLYLATGGGVIGVSAALSMLVTDRDTIDGFHDQSTGVRIETVERAGSLLGGTIGLLALALVLVAGVFGPAIGNLNAAVLVTFVVVRAALTTVAFTVGNPWPLVNPWRRIAGALPNGFYRYPEGLGSWPAVAGILAFVWLEIVAPLTSSPPTLVAVIGVYSLVTLAGAVAFGPDPWFRRADPLAVWFRLYGAVAPLQRTDDGLELRWPGSRLADEDAFTDLTVVAVIVALVWELTYSGFVVTPPGASVVEAVVGVGVPAPLLYLAVLVVGYLACLWVYWLAAGRTRDRADTYLSRRYLAIRYASPLVAIAAGYQIAHYAGFAVSLSPSLVDALTSPLSPGVNPTVLVLPGWFGYVEIAAILLGHVLAVWVAHAVSFELFPGKLQAIRSQYPFILVMVAFTMLSLWLISFSTVDPAYVPN